MSGPAASAALRPSRNQPTASRSRRLGQVAFIIVIVIAAMASVAYGVVSIAHAREFLAHHRTTGGVVTAVNLDQASVAACSANSCMITYNVTVRYQLPGKGSLTFTEGGFPEFEDAPPVGTHVLVYYLERDARLDPGTDQEHFGILLIAAGLVGFVIGYWKYRALSA